MKSEEYLINKLLDTKSHNIKGSKMSWNKITCEHCNKEVSPKEVIRSNGSGIQKYDTCPKCTMPLSKISIRGPIGIELETIDGLTKRHSIRYPKHRHINNIFKFRYDGTQHIERQSQLRTRLNNI